MATQRKIVILEDDRSTGALISAILEKEGYHVIHALQGRYAIELVFRERPSLFISDVLVPDMNGSEVVKELRNSGLGESLPTLFLTSLLDKKGKEDGSQEKTLKLNGVTYPALAKPLNPTVLIEIVRRLAGDPTFQESIEVEVEVVESVESQANEAEAAIKSQEVDEKPETQSKPEEGVAAGGASKES